MDSFGAISLRHSRQEVDRANATIERLLGRHALARLVENGAIICRKSYAAMDLQHHEVTRSRFEDCDFSDIAGNGVMWTDNQFINCRFDRADLEYANLSRCHFVGTLASGHAPDTDCATTIVGAGFNGAVLRDAYLTGIASRASSFAYADFSGSIISACALRGTFEGSLFRESNITDTSFLNSNITYADFAGVHFDNVSVGLTDLAYLFGIEIGDIGRGLCVVAKNSDIGREFSLTGADLRDLGPQLLIGYESEQQYFAAANLAYMLGYAERLMPLFKAGIRDAGMRADCRGLKLMCRLVRQVEDKQHMFGTSNLRKLYELITTGVAASTADIRNQYELHDGQVRSYLLAAQPEILEVEFQSYCHDAAAAAEIQSRILAQFEKLLRTAALELRTVGAQFSFNSYPTHTIQVIIVHHHVADQQATTKLNRHSPSPWLALAVSTLAMMFTGFNSVRPLFESKQLTAPPAAVQQTALVCHEEIKVVIVPESFSIKKDGLPVTAWESGQMILIHGQGDSSPRNLIEPH